MNIDQNNDSYPTHQESFFLNTSCIFQCLKSYLPPPTCFSTFGLFLLNGPWLNATKKKSTGTRNFEKPGSPPIGQNVRTPSTGSRVTLNPPALRWLTEPGGWSANLQERIDRVMNRHLKAPNRQGMGRIRRLEMESLWTFKHRGWLG